MSERTKKILLYGVAAPPFFLLSLVLGAYWTFPYDHLRDFIIQEVERGSDLTLEIGSLSPSWITGVELEDVRISKVPEGQTEPVTMEIPSASARISLLSLLGGTVSVSYDVALAGNGRVEGSYAQNDEATHLIARLENVHLAGLRPLTSSMRLPISGRAGGTIDMRIGAEAVNTEGNVDLRIENLAIADGQTPLEIEGLGAGLTLERLELGTLELRLESERGNGVIRRLHAGGEHAELWGTGSLRLAQPFERSTMDLLLRIQFADAYKTSSPRMEGLFALMEINPQVRPARTSSGGFQWRITGGLGGRIRMVPSGNVPMPEAE
ncbi:MAG: type II secretion system protein GspN [Sandaracinaceae bacterium]|nr:type II secretion system protein GspN [Sandaracinaceae bacterium]